MKILIVNFDNLGDVVFSSCIANTLSHHFPSAQIDVLCSSYAKEIAACYPGVCTVYDFVLPWRASLQQKKGSLSEFLRILKILRQTRYDVMLCASIHWKDVLGARMVRAEQYVGFFKRPFVRKLLTSSCPVPDNTEPIVQAMLRLVSATFPDLPKIEPLYRLISPEASEDGENSHVVLHPFSGDLRKTWPLENWLALAEKLRGEYSLRWIGSQVELEHLHSSKAIPAEEIFFETLRLVDTQKLFNQTQFFIGHDSGLTHMACGLGKRGLALYPPHTACKYYPQGVGAFQHLVGDPIGSLKVDEVLAKVLEGIDGNP